MTATKTKTAKLIALYTEPADKAAFDDAYFNTHVPLVEKIPGLRDCQVNKITKNLMGGASPYYMIAELSFDNMDALKTALASPEGKAAADNVMGFASSYITMLTSEGQ